MRLVIIRVNTVKKARIITEALRKAGRTAWCDEWYGFDGAYYTVTYKRA